MKKTLLCSFATLLPLIGNAEEIHKDNEFQDPDYETPGYVITPKATTALMQEMQPTMKFGGYIMGKYSVNDRKRSHKRRLRSPLHPSLCRRPRLQRFLL